MKSLLTLALLSFVASCALSHPLVEPNPGLEHAERFVGDWVISGPPRGGYEATIYRFSADGALRPIVSDANSGPIPTGIITRGFVEGEGCLFGDTWQSDGESTLIVSLRCGDIEWRDGLLTLVGETSPGRVEYSFGEQGRNAEGAIVSIVEVQSEVGADTGFVGWVKCGESGGNFCDWLTACDRCIFHDE